MLGPLTTNSCAYGAVILQNANMLTLALHLKNLGLTEYNVC